MTRLYWYLRGYVQFVFTGGFAEDFINALGELGITLPGLQRQGSDLRGVCSVGTYMQLHKAARQAGGRVRITARRELRCTVRRLQVHRVQTGRQVCRGVYFYGLTLVPMDKDAPPMTEVTEQRRLLRLNGRALPMGSVTRTCTAYRRVEQRLTVQAATALAKAALEEKRAQELPGATIINAYVTVEVTPDTVTAVGAYTVQVQSLQTDRDRA